MPADSVSRTLVLSVVAVDLVGYSRKSVAEQMSLKDNFNHLLLEAIRDIPVADRIILDTGDGVAMGFLGDPEDALYAAMFMHEANNRDAPAIRIGINLGPVKLAIGIGGHPNIVGDGINVAERIMTFAEPGQCTSSRPFFELMSRMSNHYTGLFQFAGVHTDKQVRAHDVYLVGKSAKAFQQAALGVKERAAQRDGHVTPAMSAATEPAFRKPNMATVKSPPAPPPELVEHYTGLINFLEDRRKVTGTAILLVVAALALGAMIADRMKRSMPSLTTPIVAEASPSLGSTDAKLATLSTPPATKPQNTTPPNAALAAKRETTALVPKAESKSVEPAIAPVTGGKGAGNLLTPKVETKPVPSTATPAAGVVATSTPKPTAAPVMAVPSAVRDQPKNADAVKTDRTEKPAAREPTREDPRKTPTRPSNVEQNATGATTPAISSGQVPVQAPRTESVAPTPTPTQVALAAPSTEVLVVSRSAPPFPIEGIRQAIQSGFVKARLTIDAQGNVTSVDILEAKPIPAFARETRQTLKDWKFNPGTSNRTYEIEISFKP